ncbi:uncharacterized protein LOC127527089 [Erpetoichthys calabaricus]|uniref:uncharacterized protein LOC127527089 n=1 Tax=Erpetoichthys calabaricus TaxID=27687 RepID=UPI002233EA90|nr:uncharacterized protein LOC127527089 [Erpetoichthys calabaricus]
MTGVAQWNYQRLVDVQQPGVLLPGVFDQALISELNAASKRVTGEEKYLTLHLSDRDTGEIFGLEYIEPGYQPVVLDWEKYKKKTESSVLFETANESSSTTVQALPSPPASTGPSVLFQFPPVADIKAEVSLCRDADTLSETEPPSTPSLPLLSSPASARTGPVKTGGRVFVLDHRRWTSQMKEATDNLINKYHGQKDLLKLVDHDYAAMVQKSCRDPNTMFNPTTRVHIDRCMKYLAKMKNVSSSLNTSQEKLIETQRLWHSLTEGSHTAHVPVVTMSPAIVHPSSPFPVITLSQDSIEKIVHEFLEKQQKQQQQHHQQPQIHKKRTKSCLSYGQPKSRYENDGSSVHFFYQQGLVRYFYCSNKVFKMYGSEGLTDPKMQFKDFAET